MIERSLVLMKPDAVQRGIVGEILSRFERMGLKIVGAKLIQAGEELSRKHYNHDDEWAVKTGMKNLEECDEYNLNPVEIFGTDDAKEIGKMIDKWSAFFISSAPVLALVLAGPNAVQRIRDHVGKLFPFASPPGTIRGDYGLDSSPVTMRRGRVTYNLIHASGTVEEAQQEIDLWFKKDELLDYKRIHEDLYKY